MLRSFFFLGSILMLFIGQIALVSASPVTLIYSGNLDGELEPCGCSEGGDFGGILRRATILDALRKKDPALVAVSSGGLLANESARDRLKSDYILKGYSTFGYDAVAVQWRDLAYGVEFMAGYQMPWVASNWLEGEVAKKRLIEREGVKLAFFSWLDPGKSPFRAMHGEHQVVSEDMTALQRALKEAKAAGQLTILSATWPLKKAQKSFDLSQVDILLIRSAYEVFSEPQKVGNTVVLQPGSRGMRLGRFDLDYQDGAIVKWQHEVIEMPSSVPDAERLSGWYEAYNAKVKEAYLKSVEVKKALESGESPFVGAKVCQECHQPQFDVWSGTLHANAFEKLENVNKGFDPDCIVCHTVGFDKGGYVDFALTPHLMNVQCENCHGAGRDHADSKGQVITPNKGWQPSQVCGQCHRDSHSPDFKFEVYWPKVAH